MKNFFLEKFKHKSISELELIVENRKGYDAAAVEAAVELLNQYREIPISLPNEVTAKEKVEEENPRTLARSFDFRPFLDR